MQPRVEIPSYCVNSECMVSILEHHHSYLSWWDQWVGTASILNSQALKSKTGTREIEKSEAFIWRFQPYPLKKSCIQPAIWSPAHLFLKHLLSVFS